NYRIDSARSINRPGSWRDQFQKVAIGIPEVEALPAKLPPHFALYRNVFLCQSFFPGFELRRRDRKSHVRVAASQVGGIIPPVVPPGCGAAPPFPNSNT